MCRFFAVITIRKFVTISYDIKYLGYSTHMYHSMLYSKIVSDDSTKKISTKSNTKKHFNEYTISISQNK